MSKQLPLHGEYVIFTGIPRSTEAVDLTTQFGAKPVIAPFISTKDIDGQDDKRKLRTCNNYDWLIFTSQSSVNAFIAKMKRFQLKASFFQSKIAVVGSQTASAMENEGFIIDFTPTIYSADVFVKEFPAVSATSETCLFVRGNLAKNTITDGLLNEVDEWTIYETVIEKENTEQVRSLLKSDVHCSVIFSSPSTVEEFDKTIASDIGYDGFTVCAIGHITRNHLQSLGATVHVMPDTYTLTEVVHELVKWKGRE